MSDSSISLFNLPYNLHEDPSQGMRSGSSHKDLEKAERQKYKELLKKYRNAESDRKSYAMETAAIIKK